MATVPVVKVRLCCCGYSICQDVIDSYPKLQSQDNFLSVIKAPPAYTNRKQSEAKEAKRKDDIAIKAMYRRRTLHHLKIKVADLSKTRTRYNKFHHPEWQHQFLYQGTKRQFSISLESVPAGVNIDQSEVYRGTSNHYLLVPNAPLNPLLEGLNKDEKLKKKQKQKQDTLETEMAATLAPHMKHELKRMQNEVNTKNKEIDTLRQLLQTKNNKLEEAMQEKSDIAKAKDLLEIEIQKLNNIASDDETLPFCPFGVKRSTLTDPRFHEVHPWAVQPFFGMVPLHARKSLGKTCLCTRRIHTTR